MTRWAGVALGLGGLGTAALGAGAAGWLPGAQQELRTLQEQGVQPTAEQEQAAENERNAMAAALLVTMSGTAAAGTQVDWSQPLLWPGRELSVSGLSGEGVTGQRMAGEVRKMSEADRLAAADYLVKRQAMPGSALAKYRDEPTAYRQGLMQAFDQLKGVAQQQKLSDEQFEQARLYVQQAVQAAPEEVLERAAALERMAVASGLGENQREAEVLYRVPSVDVRSQADAFVASLPPADEIQQRLAGFDVMKGWIDGPGYELAGRLLSPHLVEKLRQGRSDYGALRQVLAHERTANNRLNHGWASAAMGALKQGGVDSVESYFRQLGQKHGQDLSDWSFPEAVRAVLPPRHRGV
jgi:hypothetical protein